MFQFLDQGVMFYPETIKKRKGMTRRKQRTSPKRANVKSTQSDREEEYRAIIEPDPLLKEVGEANERIADPAERERVIPSRPC
jgi:hypothetical protein